MVGLCGVLVINVGFWTRGVWRGNEMALCVTLFGRPSSRRRKVT